MLGLIGIARVRTPVSISCGLRGIPHPNQLLQRRVRYGFFFRPQVASSIS